MIKEAQVVIHKTHQPDVLGDFFDAEILSCEDVAEIDLAASEANAAALCNRDGAVMKRISGQSMWPTIRHAARGDRVQPCRSSWLLVLNDVGQPLHWLLRPPDTQDSVPVTDKAQLDQYGLPKKIGTELRIDKKQATVVCEAFERFAGGESCGSIAADFNRRGIPSPGSYWKGRKVRRCSGWQASAVRVIVLNPLYTGKQRWNVSKFLHDPDSKKATLRLRCRRGISCGT